MNIQINTTYPSKYKYSPSFKTNNRVVKNIDYTVKWRNTTNFFRSDLEWEKMVDYFIKKYENVDKVRTICYACSDGSEPTSLAMMLVDKLGDKADKFFPIIAKDIDPDIIKKASSGRIELEHSDKNSITNFLHNDISEYLTMAPLLPRMYSINAEVKAHIRDSIHYSVADIRSDIYTIPEENTIVFARNFWPYLTDKEDVNNLIKILKQKLSNNGLLAIGNFDIFAGIRIALIRSGFKTNKSGLNNIYEI